MVKHLLPINKVLDLICGIAKKKKNVTWEMVQRNELHASGNPEMSPDTARLDPPKRKLVWLERAYKLERMLCMWEL